MFLVYNSHRGPDAKVSTPASSDHVDLQLVWAVNKEGKELGAWGGEVREKFLADRPSFPIKLPPPLPIAISPSFFCALIERVRGARWSRYKKREEIILVFSVWRLLLRTIKLVGRILSKVVRGTRRVTANGANIVARYFFFFLCWVIFQTHIKFREFH